MAQAMVMPKKYFFKPDGTNAPLSFGYVVTYLKGTTNDQLTWKDEDQVTENANPVVLNDLGYAQIFLNGEYSIEVYDVDDNLVWTDDISSIASVSDGAIRVVAGAPDDSIVVEVDGTSKLKALHVLGVTQFDDIVSFLDTLNLPTYPLTTSGKQYHDSVNGMNYAGEGTLSDHTFRDKDGNIICSVPTGTKDMIFNGTVQKNGTHPAFRAISSAQQIDVTGDGTVVGIVVGNEIKDQGSNFTNSTFTAHVPGFYFFVLKAYVLELGAGHTVLNLSLVTTLETVFLTTNGANVADANQQFIPILSDLMWMDAGDTATGTLAVTGSTKTINIFNSANTSFSGILQA